MQTDNFLMYLAGGLELGGLKEVKPNSELSKLLLGHINIIEIKYKGVKSENDYKQYEFIMMFKGLLMFGGVEASFIDHVHSQLLQYLNITTLVGNNLNFGYYLLGAYELDEITITTTQQYDISISRDKIVKYHSLFDHKSELYNQLMFLFDMTSRHEEPLSLKELIQLKVHIDTVLGKNLVEGTKPFADFMEKHKVEMGKKIPNGGRLRPIQPPYDDSIRVLC
jgi:hypothetical protein